MNRFLELFVVQVKSNEIFSIVRFAEILAVSFADSFFCLRNPEGARSTRD